MSETAGWIPARSTQDWHEALQGLAELPAMTPAYAQAAERVTGHEAGLWWCRQASGSAACALQRRPSPGGGYHLATPIGFGGFALAGDPDLERGWTQFWRDKGALAAYVQLAPEPGDRSWTDALAPLSGNLSASRECCLWDLHPEPEALVAGMSSKHRQLLHKWQRESVGLSFDRERLEPEFNRLYGEFIARRELSPAYHYDAEAICLLANDPGSLFVGACAADGSVEAVMLFLSRGRDADSFLSASTVAGRRHSRGLYWQGALALRERGVRRLNLGGGLSDGDELSQFKQRLGATRVPTLALRQLFDPAGFDRACQQAGLPADAGGRFPPWA